MTWNDMMKCEMGTLCNYYDEIRLLIQDNQTPGMFAQVMMAASAIIKRERDSHA